MWGAPAMLLSGQGRDPEDGDLGAGQLAWYDGANGEVGTSEEPEGVRWFDILRARGED